MPSGDVGGSAMTTGRSARWIGMITSGIIGLSWPSPASAGTPTVQVGTNATLGSILVDAQGAALYTYSGDTSPTATCTGSCAQSWPPLTVAAGTQPTAGSGVAGTVGSAAQNGGG